MPLSQQSGIKSVTRGILTISGVSSTTATIPAVNLSKTEVRYLGNEAAAANTLHSESQARLYLNNATTIGAIRQSNGGAAVVTYEITEWY